MQPPNYNITLDPVEIMRPETKSDEYRFVEGRGQGMRAVEVVIRELARNDAPVLLLAERGAGKEATARRIHALSERSAQPFRVLACAGLTADLFRSVQHDLRGGTLYLEELADLSLACQELLLAFLPSVECDDDGDEQRPRLISGSAQDLEGLVKAGRLREDVYYRTSGVCLRLPPLRQRREDIPQLMSFFLERYAYEFKRPVPVLGVETERLLREYEWPGNIRELEDAARAMAALGDEQLAMEGFRQRWVRASSEIPGERISLKEAARAASRKAERELILRVLDRTRWNRRRAAEELQISYKALLYKLKQIELRDYRAQGRA
jgi:two-component system response regulator AtoC